MRLLIALVLSSLITFGADDPIAKAFTARVEDYANVRKAVAAKNPRLPKEATPEEIAANERALVDALRAARTNAKQGDVFTPDAQRQFAAIIKGHLTAASTLGKNSRAIAKQGNPKHDAGAGEASPVIQVNAVYPKSAPVSSMPPLLLMQLPTLPKDIEYRFVGSTLVLCDSLSNLIIDYIAGVAPGL